MNNNFLPYQLKKNAEQNSTLATQMAQNTSQLKTLSINVKTPLGTNLTPAKGDGATDDTTAIQAIINYAQTNKLSVYIPSGTFIHSGLTIPNNVSITGAGKYLTILQNTSTTNPNLYVTGSNLRISDMSVIGNGTQLNGANATTGKGIQMDGSTTAVSYVNIENCSITGNGGQGINFFGGCWIINVVKCDISRNKLEGVRIDNSGTGAQSGQQNAINLDKNTIAYNGSDGVFGWGCIINITQNVIEGNTGAGVSFDGSKCINPNITSGVNGANVCENYFESNGLGHVYLKAGAYNTPTIYRQIEQVRIEGNYGYQDVTKFTSGVTASVTCISEGTNAQTVRIRAFKYDGNLFYLSNYTGYNVADFGNALDEGSMLRLNYENPLGQAINFGRATTIGAKQLVINGYFLAKGITYSGFLESDNVPTGTTVRYPVQLPALSMVNMMGIYVDTDATNYNIQLTIKSRNNKGVGAYSTVCSYTKGSANGSMYVQSNDLALYGTTRSLIDSSDVILEILVTINTAGTYLKLGNPVLNYIS